MYPLLSRYLGSIMSRRGHLIPFSRVLIGGSNLHSMSGLINKAYPKNTWG